MTEETQYARWMGEGPGDPRPDSQELDWPGELPEIDELWNDHWLMATITPNQWEVIRQVINPFRRAA